MVRVDVAFGVGGGHARSMQRIVVTGAAGTAGREVVRVLAARGGGVEVRGLDLRSAPHTEPVDLVTADLADAFAGADAVVHLASVFGPSIEGPEVDDAVEVTLARRVLGAAAEAGCQTVVLASSATVYGPWANNPVPLTEDAPLRPHPELAQAVQLAEVERVAAEWAADHPGVRVVRLRAAPIVGEGYAGWLARALDAAGDVPTSDENPAQYLHVSDLAAAVEVALSSQLEGPVNVAPDGWLTPTQRRALDPVPRVRLPEAVALKVAGWRWRLGLAPTAPGILPYARHPWVVANDRLVAAGWTATVSNEEAYVAGHEASAIESISPQRRQELALGAMAVAGAVVVAGAVAVLNRRGSPRCLRWCRRDATRRARARPVATP
jgi:nucleoside-diphosphate-sugar epimerase